MSASIWASISSSSTTRMRWLPTSTCPTSCTGAEGLPQKTGRCKVTVVPMFSRLSMRTRPPWRDTMPYTTDSPSPVPRAPFVVKKGSNARRRTSDRHPDARVADEALDRLAEGVTRDLVQTRARGRRG